MRSVFVFRAYYDVVLVEVSGKCAAKGRSFCQVFSPSFPMGTKTVVICCSAAGKWCSLYTDFQMM